MALIKSFKYKIINADAEENNTDGDRFLIKVESETESANIPNELEKKCTDIFLEPHDNE